MQRVLVLCVLAACSNSPSTSPDDSTDGSTGDASNGPDTTAPNRVLGCQATGIADGVEIECDAASDPFAATPGMGVAHYEVCKDGADCVVVEAAGPGLSRELVLHDPSGVAPTITPVAGSASSWAFSSIGDVDSTAPVYSAGEVTGPAFVSGRVSDLVVTTDWGKCGFIVGAQPDTRGPYLALHVQKLLDGTVQLQARARREAEGVADNVFTIDVTGDPYVKLEELSPGTFGFFYSNDGARWLSADEPYSIDLSATKYWGAFVAGGAAGEPTSCELHDVSLSDQPRWKHTYITATSGEFTARAVDAAGNASPFSAAITGGPATPVTSDAGLLYHFAFDSAPTGDIDTAGLAAIGLEYSRHQGKTSISAAHAREGTKSIRLQLGGDNCRKTDGSANPGCYGSAREELYPTGEVTVDGAPSKCMNGNAGCAMEGVVFWHGFSIYIDTWTPQAGALLYQLQQLGSGPSACDDANQPFFSMHAGNSGWTVGRKAWKTRTPGVSPGGLCESGTVFDRQKVFDSFVGPAGNLGDTVDVDRWVDFVYRFQFDKDPGQARVTIWKDGEQVYDEANTPLGFEVFADGSFKWHSLAKWGVYHWHTQVSGNFDVYYDAVRTSGPNLGSYELVAPRGTSAF